MDDNKIINRIFAFCIIFTIAVIGLLVILSINSSKYTEYKYQLSEIQDGVYGVYGNVVSSIPAQNYEMITLCCDGQIKTFKGRVNITYTDETPYVILKDCNLVNADKIYVYVPFGTIEYQGTTGVGSRR
jgi:hypothetical protein